MTKKYVGIKDSLLSSLLFFIILLNPELISAQKQVLFNQDWEFRKLAEKQAEPSMFTRSNGTQQDWEKISLPHTCNIEAVNSGEKQWQGHAAYRKFFRVPREYTGKRITVRFESAMHTADIYLNGKYIRTHYGGYLPFSIDLTDQLNYQGENCILLVLSNIDDPHVPPGKALADLDFNFYSGIYRNAYLEISNPLHITDAVEADHEAGGGIMTWFEMVSNISAYVNVKTEVANQSPDTRDAYVTIKLYDQAGRCVASSRSGNISILTGMSFSFLNKFRVAGPSLWTPVTPDLYRLEVSLISSGKTMDSRILKIGIRTFSFSKENGFELNGRKLKIRGTNRHQEYPYVGYALSDNAQFRDAYKIKKAGFNFVRCSHYPQSPAFLDACDQLGILVMNSIPGWQYFGDSVFQERSIQDIKDLIHRDRNHPSVILWEASLNETAMSEAYMRLAHQTVHKELPFKDVYTCGWMDTIYDVFIPARQHAKPPFYWNDYTKNKPLLIAEYGDWEYYAQNAGFNQKEYANLKEEERSSRQRRADGEKRLLQQAINFREAHNDNLKGPACGDANWLMFDYKRGYAPDIEASGIMDIFRLPKYSYYFYASQANPRVDGEPVIFIADEWSDSLSKDITVYSNCDEVELLINGRSFARQSPDKNSICEKLEFPATTFQVGSFTPGTITAKGYLYGEVKVETSRTTPGSPSTLKVEADISRKSLKAGCNDLVFLYASVVDRNGTVISINGRKVKFTCTGDAEIIGDNPAVSEAGIATVLLKAGKQKGIVQLKAESDGLLPGTGSITVR